MHRQAEHWHHNNLAIVESITRLVNQGVDCSFICGTPIIQAHVDIVRAGVVHVVFVVKNVVVVESTVPNAHSKRVVHDGIAHRVKPAVALKRWLLKMKLPYSRPFVQLRSQ